MKKIYSLLVQQDKMFQIIGVYLSQDDAINAKNNHCVTTSGPINKYEIQEHIITINIK